MYVDRDDEWFGEQVGRMSLPEALGTYDGALERLFKEVVDLKRSTIQVILKLANIVLTPQKPEYGGGTWHAERMENEHIASTFIHVCFSQFISSQGLSYSPQVAFSVVLRRRQHYFVHAMFPICNQPRRSSLPGRHLLHETPLWLRTVRRQSMDAVHRAH